MHTSKSALMEVLQEMREAVKERDKEEDSGGPEKLKNLYDSYTHRHDFKAGDLVQWKRCCRRAKLPAYGKPAVILEIAHGRRSDGAEHHGSNFENEPREARIGVVNDGSFMGFWVDINRLEPYQPVDVEPVQEGQS